MAGWHWRPTFAAAGADEDGYTRAGYASRFPTQAEAEAWLAECWAELAEAGVVAVTLLEGERVVYGPMDLSG